MISARASITRVTAPVVARSARRTARLLRHFAATELGSAFTMRWAAAHVTDDARRAAYLRHALDEERHARMFEARANRLDPGARAPIRSDAEDLFAILGERRFLAFVAFAEGRGRRQFEAHRRAASAAGDAVTAALFDAIIADEHGHERYARDLLARLSPATARHGWIEVAVWESIRASRRAADAIMRLVFRGIMTVVYVLLFPLAIVARRTTRRRSVLLGTTLPEKALGTGAPPAG